MSTYVSILVPKRRTIGFILAGLLTITLAGCGSPAEDSRQNMHKLQMALLEYAAKHEGKWPERLDEIKDEVGGDAALLKLMKNPLTGDSRGYEYVMPTGNGDGKVFDRQQVILYQLRGGKRDTSVKVGYADGAVRMLDSK